MAACTDVSYQVLVPQAQLSNAVTLSVNTSLTIPVQPANTTTCLGVNTSFNITASGSGLGYQWQVNTGSGFTNLTNGGNYSGVTTDELNISAPTLAMNSYQYRCIVSSTCVAPVSSSSAILTVLTPPAISNSPSDASVCMNGTATFTVAATGPGLSYQWQINTGSGWSNLVLGPGYFGLYNPSLIVSLVQPSQNGYQYRCVVSGTCAPSVLSSPANLIVNTPPVLTAATSSANVCPGNNTTLSVTANGTALTYQWQLEHKWWW